MSWWETGERNDVIGDQPADIIRRVLKRIAEERDRQSRPKPTLAELLQTLGTIALEARGKQLDAVPEDLRGLVVDLETGQEVSSSPLGQESLNQDLAAELRAALDEVANQYHSRWDRVPKFTELLEIVLFILGYQPERFLQDGGNRVPVKIRSF
jgi:hypothetical protein